MEIVECVPDYWRGYANDSNHHGVLRRCKKDQYARISNIFEGYIFDNRNSSLNEMLEISCNETIANIHYSSKHKNIDEPSDLYDEDISFHYTSDWYRDVVNEQAYTLETLVGQVGGFVGKKFCLPFFNNIF